MQLIKMAEEDWFDLEHGLKILVGIKRKEREEEEAILAMVKAHGVNK